MAFVTSHPIQYQVPVFRHLSERDDIHFEVLFAMLPDAAAQGAGFGVEFEWDIPLLEGYPYSVLENVSKRPGVTHYTGCDTPAIDEELRRREIDAVVVNGWVVKTCVQTLRACRRLGIPCIVRGEANHLRPRPWWKKVLQRQLIRRYDAYLPIGTANRAFYRSYGVADSQMFDARYCIENARFNQAACLANPRRNTIRQQWGIAPDETCYLFCGKFELKKHPVELVHAFEDSLSNDRLQHPSTVNKSRLLMVGDGELRPQCQQYSESRSLPITLTGFLNQSEIVDAYIASDCLVLPSDHGETWGLVVNEAMACGLPAIVSDQVGCARDLIHESQTGFCFSFGDWDALARILNEVASGRFDLKSMGNNARSQIAEYSPEAAAQGILHAVDFCLRNPA
ncbi:Glycosyl transferase, group 1 [Rhodopirellula maiorica SM1]|uniref:Glycosyl transferase, group 1 n=1 Tax=Rhodopirellula maiorica SM1 TaxID=1265738 RepID=M5RVC5_9BACT|nr:glycosyltransferase family 4 protein [Rhodopirellula maiorica]EMI17909.1 Glycosyl transferase, group 1 [Rhodopirellula maiorica SM1]